MLRTFPKVPIKVCYPFRKAVLCQIFGKNGEVGYTVFEIHDLVKFEVASLVKHSSGIEICLN